MPTFSAPDATLLAYRTIGTGEPVICLPGGPMQDSRYLDELGGLSAHHQLVLLDLRGTGESAVPEDTTTYRCDRQVDDVEALREHLGLERMNLLGHSAGVHLATLYTARFPNRVSRLALIGPSTISVGIPITGETRRDVALKRTNEPWFGKAFAALDAITTGHGSDEDWDAIAPFFYGRWDATAQSHHALRAQRINNDAAAVYASEGAFSPEHTRAALAEFREPTLLLVGEFDMNNPVSAVAEFAALFHDARFVVQPGAGHFPWLDDPAHFTATVNAFLT